MKLDTFTDYLYTESLGSNISKVTSTWLTYKFANLIRKKFIEWDAYKLGLIDRTGNLIREPKTYDEKKVMGLFENLVRKVKRAIGKYVSDSAIINTLIAIYLIKTESRSNGMIAHAIADDLTNDEIMMLEQVILEMKGAM